MNWKLKEYIHDFTEHDDLITIGYYPNSLEKFFGKKPHEKKFIGSVTWWSYYPSFIHVGTLKDEWLLNIYHREKHKKELRDKIGKNSVES